MILIIVGAGLILPLNNADSQEQSSCPSRQLSKRSTYLPPVTCSGEHIRAALQAAAGCTPREKVVKIPWPNNTDVYQLTPTHVTVARCGGGCDQNKQICVSVASGVKIVPVLLGRCGITAGMCDEECEDVEVEDDLKCGCQCAVKKEDCSTLQHYREDLCSCKCLNLSLARNCYDSGRMWDPASCSCQCPIKLQCSTGLVFDNNATCSCIPFISKIFTEIRSERSSQNFVISWEIIIISFLLVIIIIFIIITIFLVKNHYTMKRNLSLALNSFASNKNLYSSPRLAPDNTMCLLDSETEFSSKRPTNSSLCSDSDSRNHSSPAHKTSIAPSDHSSFSRFTPESILLNPGTNSPANFVTPSVECLPVSRAQSSQSLVDGRPPITKKPVGIQVPGNQDEMPVSSGHHMEQCNDTGEMDQQCHMRQYSEMGDMGQIGQNCHMGHYSDMGHQCQMGQHIPVNSSTRRMVYVGQSDPLYQSRQSQIVYSTVQNVQNVSNPHLGQIRSNPNPKERGVKYHHKDNGPIYKLEQNYTNIQVGRSGSLVRMGPKPSSSNYGPSLQINPNDCYVTY